MISGPLHIRPLLPKDNRHLARVIREVLHEYNLPRQGSALSDPSLDEVYATYQHPRSVYWVVEDGIQIFGGGGIAPLRGGGSGTCELQKMYFKKALRGRGMGERLLRQALSTALIYGYDHCYLETIPAMEAALNLYRRFGFKELDRPRGNTGHPACTVWMTKNLKDL